jgi:hypothetical protein
LCHQYISTVASYEPAKAYLKLYSQLKKAESSMLFQARTGRIGLRRILARVGVPAIEEDCLCGEGRETAEHVLIQCRQQAEQRWDREVQFEELMSNPKLAKLAVRQLIKSGRLGQYKPIDAIPRRPCEKKDYTQRESSCKDTWQESVLRRTDAILNCIWLVMESDENEVDGCSQSTGNDYA